MHVLPRVLALAIAIARQLARPIAHLRRQLLAFHWAPPNVVTWGNTLCCGMLRMYCAVGLSVYSIGAMYHNLCLLQVTHGNMYSLARTRVHILHTQRHTSALLDVSRNSKLIMFGRR